MNYQGDHKFTITAYSPTGIIRFLFTNLVKIRSHGDDLVLIVGIGGLGIQFQIITRFRTQGLFEVDSESLVWKTNCISLEILMDQIRDITWTQISRTNQLGVLVKDGAKHRFNGFSDEEISSLITILKNTCHITVVEEKQLSVAGKNWGRVDTSGDVLPLADGPKQLFEVPLANVLETDIIKRKDDVVLKFDTSTSSHKGDSLSKMTFHVSRSNTQFVGLGSAAEELKKNIQSVTAAVVTFEDVTVISPRPGKYVVELHRSYLMVQRNANRFKVDYRLISDVCMLPQHDTSHTYVVISLHTPIRKGRSLYNHIVFQFDAPGSKEGCIAKGFTVIVCGLAGTELTKTDRFRGHKDGFAVESLLKDEPGLLYPLHDCFLFLPEPPTRILYDKIDNVRFERHVYGRPNEEYFDVRVRLKTKQEQPRYSE